MVNVNEEKYYGKYMGKVEENFDRQGLGRIKVKVRFLENKKIGWAMPCVPYAGENVGMFFIPPKNANVWIEFLNGDLDTPIYVGCFWNKDEVPNGNKDPDIHIIKTKHVTLTMDDNDNKNRIEIKTENNQKIVITPNTIELYHPHGCSVVLKSEKVSINGKNLVVKK
jgi:uncharacterized protein involved in type VI secretion and phage assembly